MARIGIYSTRPIGSSREFAVFGHVDGREVSTTVEIDMPQEEVQMDDIVEAFGAWCAAHPEGSERDVREPRPQRANKPRTTARSADGSDVGDDTADGDDGDVSDQDVAARRSALRGQLNAMSDEDLREFIVANDVPGVGVDTRKEMMARLREWIKTQ